MIEKRVGLFVEIVIVFEDRVWIIFFFVLIIFFVMIGIVVEMASFCIVFGIIFSNILISVGLEFFIILRLEVMDCEFIKNIF